MKQNATKKEIICITNSEYTEDETHKKTHAKIMAKHNLKHKGKPLAAMAILEASRKVEAHTAWGLPHESGQQNLDGWHSAVFGDTHRSGKTYGVCRSGEECFVVDAKQCT